MITRRTRERLDAEAGDHPAGGGVGALAGDAFSQADGDGAAAAPRIVFCDVTGRRDLALRLAPLVARRPRRTTRPRSARVDAPRTRGHVAVERHRRGADR